MKPDNLVYETSIKKRISWNLLSGFFGIFISLFTFGLVPRFLGPEAYGHFNFITRFFGSFFGTAECDTSNCLISKVSERPEDRKIITFYTGVILILFVSGVAFTLGVFFSGHSNKLWPGILPLWVWLGFFLGFIDWVTQIIRKISHAYGLTVSSETVSMIQRVVFLAVLFTLIFTETFSLRTYFFYLYAANIFMCVGWIIILRRFGLRFYHRLSFSEIKTYISIFYIYTKPLVFSMIIGYAASIIENLLVLKFSGAKEFGYLSFGQKLGTIGYTITLAVAPILTREFAKAFGQNRPDNISNIYMKYVPPIFMLASVIGGFFAVFSPQITRLFGGSEFVFSPTALFLFLLYPIHQTLAHINLSLFYGTSDTNTYKNTRIFSAFLHLTLALILLGPSSWGGLNLGALGFSLKLFFGQLIVVKYETYLLARKFDLSLKKLWAHQIVSVFLCIGLAKLSSFLLYFLPAWEFKRAIIVLGSSGILYLFLCSLFVFIFPWLVAMSRENLVKQARNSFIFVHRKLGG